MSTLRTFFTKVKVWIVSHKKMSIAGLLVLVLVGYGIVKATSTTIAEKKYVLAAVERGTLISSVSGTGQVSASSNISVPAKASGAVTSINVKVGDTVKEGAVIARIDDRDAQRTLSKAAQSLASAKISYQKSLQQSNTTLTTTVQSVESAQTNLAKAYEDAYDAASSVFIDVPSIILSLNKIYYTANYSPYFSDQYVQSAGGSVAMNYKYQGGIEFDKVKNTFDAKLSLYKTVSKTSDAQTIVNLVEEARAIALQTQSALRATNNTIDYVNLRITGTKPTEIDRDKTELSSNLSKITSDVNALTSALTSITDAKKSLENAQNTYANNTTSINGQDNLDVQAAKIALAQQQTSYAEALDTVANYTVRAPFDGVIAAIAVEKGQTISNGTAVATLITPQKVASISLNEVDVAKVKAAQKATLTFDAVEDLTITGQVLSVDLVGTVSQGVVNYNVKIGFDVQDDRIKPGMSVSATVVTESKPNVLVVPSSAVKTNASGSYVEVLDGIAATADTTGGVTSATAPRQVSVTIGSSSDSQVELVSGVNEGDMVVTRTITASTSTTKTTSTTQNRSGASVLGVPTGGGARTFSR